MIKKCIFYIKFCNPVSVMFLYAYGSWVKTFDEINHLYRNGNPVISAIASSIGYVLAVLFVFFEFIGRMDVVGMFLEFFGIPVATVILVIPFFLCRRCFKNLGQEYEQWPKSKQTRIIYLGHFYLVLLGLMLASLFFTEL